MRTVPGLALPGPDPGVYRPHEGIFVMNVPTDRIAAATLEVLCGPPGDPATVTGTRLLREALRLLAGGEPITRTRLAEAADVAEPDLAGAPMGRDIEYDQAGRIVGWGLTLNPTPHRFTVDGRRLYTYCAPDTLIFPAIIGRAAHIDSPCPITGTTVRLSVDPVAGVAALDPPGAVVSITDPTCVDDQRIRATLCDPQRFFATAEAARDWRARYPGVIALPVADAHRDIAVPFAQATLAGGTPGPGTRSENP